MSAGAIVFMGGMWVIIIGSSIICLSSIIKHQKQGK